MQHSAVCRHLFLASIPVLVLTGCLDTAPTVVTGRDAGFEDAGALVLPGELLPSDPPNCLTCAAAESSDWRANHLCTADETATTASSSARFATFVGCACRTACVTACAAPCNGAPMNATCERCVASSCAAERSACEAP